MENMNLNAFSPKKAELEVVVTQFKDLKINGVDDKDGFKKVHEAEMIIKKHRTGINNQCKEFTDFHEQKKKGAWKMRDELLDVISPLENSLKEQKKAIVQEKAKIKEEKEKKEQEVLNKKINQLAEYGVTIDLFNLKMMSEEEFDSYLQNAKVDFEAKKLKQQQEEEKQAEEKKKQEEAAEKLKKEREEFDVQKKKMDEDQRKMDEEKKKVQDEKDAIEREKQEKIRKEAEEKRIEEAKIQAKKEAEEESERKKIEEQKKEEEELKFKQEQLEKDKKYKAFLKKYEGKYDDKIKINGKTTLIKIIAQYEI